MDMVEPFGVGRPHASGAPTEHIRTKGSEPLPGEHLRPRAVFVAHGMGQQVPFETLDDVARGLCKELDRRDIETVRLARTVRSDCETLQRLELYLQPKKEGSQPLPPIHLYEAYWAPLTEGAIGLWQVLRFLFSGGWNALRSDARLHRFMFGKPRQFRVNRWSLAAIFLVIFIVLALVVIGATITGVAVAKLTFEDRGWVTKELVAHLTALFERLVGVLAASALVAVILVAIARLLLPKNAKGVRYQFARGFSWLTVLPAAVMIGALLFSAFLAIPLIFMFDQEPLFPGRECPWCPGSVGMLAKPGATVTNAAHSARHFVGWLLQCPLPEHSTWALLIGIALALVFRAAYSPFGKKDSERGRGGHITGVFFAVVALTGVVTLCGYGDALAFVTWLLLFCVVLFVRSFLIQFAGDVAIYVSPHALDRFFDLRRRIKDTVWRTARAVYAYREKVDERLYGDIVVVGHSLGSVVVYDVLNRLINEDELSEGVAPECCEDVPVESLNAAARTRLLLTFGSPLDKTAFIFAAHDLHAASERDVLAAAVQPLICNERPFRWVNLWTPFDILGGKLDYYDTPERDNENRVENRIDPKAITPLMGHTEFWRNTLLYEVIADGLSVPTPPASPSSPPPPPAPSAATPPSGRAPRRRG